MRHLLSPTRTSSHRRLAAIFPYGQSHGPRYMPVLKPSQQRTRSTVSCRKISSFPSRPTTEHAALRLIHQWEFRSQKSNLLATFLTTPNSAVFHYRKRTRSSRSRLRFQGPTDHSDGRIIKPWVRLCFL